MGRWLITGCSTGFGREIARAALEAGHSVVVTARRAEAVADFTDEFGDRALAVARGDAVACEVAGGWRVARSGGRLSVAPPETWQDARRDR